MIRMAAKAEERSKYHRQRNPSEHKAAALVMDSITQVLIEGAEACVAIAETEDEGNGG